MLGGHQLGENRRRSLTAQNGFTHHGEKTLGNRNANSRRDFNDSGITVDESLATFLKLEEWCNEPNPVVPKICINDETQLSTSTASVCRSDPLNETFLQASDSESFDTGDESDESMNDTIDQFDYISKRIEAHQMQFKKNEVNLPITSSISANRLKLLQQFGSGNARNSAAKP